MGGVTVRDVDVSCYVSYVVEVAGGLAAEGRLAGKSTRMRQNCPRRKEQSEKFGMARLMEEGHGLCETVIKTRGSAKRDDTPTRRKLKTYSSETGFIWARLGEQSAYIDICGG